MKRVSCGSLVLVMGLLLPVAGAAVEVPWATFSEAAQAGTLVQSGIGACPNVGEVMEVILPYQTDVWVYWYATASGRLVMAYYPQERNEPTEVGVGTVNMAAPDAIPPMQWRAYTPTTPGPCDLLRPTT